MKETVVRSNRPDLIEKLGKRFSDALGRAVKNREVVDAALIIADKNSADGSIPWNPEDTYVPRGAAAKGNGRST